MVLDEYAVGVTKKKIYPDSQIGQDTQRETNNLNMLSLFQKWASRSLSGSGTSTDECSNVLEAYNNAGCCPTCNVVVPPGWAGKTCYTVFKLSFGGIETYVYDGFQFSEDGLSYTERFSADTNKTQLELTVESAVAASQFQNFGYLCIDDYKVQKMYDDPTLTWGVLQYSNNPDAFCGYGSQNNGIRFFDNFSRATYISAPEVGLLCESWWGCSLVNGTIWVKAPPAYAVDDDGNSTNPILSCVTVPPASPLSPQPLSPPPRPLLPPYVPHTPPSPPTPLAQFPPTPSPPLAQFPPTPSPPL